MKTLILFLLPLALLAAERPKKANTRPAPAAQKSAALMVPADAVQVDSYTWRYTDKDQKTWIYRKTPFGLSKGLGETPVTAAGTKPEPANVPVKVVDTGDSYRFERPMPMGAQVWTRKKSELTADEKAAVEAAAGTEKTTTSAPAVPAEKH